MRVIGKEFMLTGQGMGKADRHLPTQDEHIYTPSHARSWHLFSAELKGTTSGEMGVHTMASAWNLVFACFGMLELSSIINEAIIGQVCRSKKGEVKERGGEEFFCRGSVAGLPLSYGLAHSFFSVAHSLCFPGV